MPSSPGVAYRQQTTGTNLMPRRKDYFFDLGRQVKASRRKASLGQNAEADGARSSEKSKRWKATTIVQGRGATRDRTQNEANGRRPRGARLLPRGGPIIDFVVEAVHKNMRAAEIAKHQQSTQPLRTIANQKQVAAGSFRIGGHAIRKLGGSRSRKKYFSDDLLSRQHRQQFRDAFPYSNTHAEGVDASANFPPPRRQVLPPKLNESRPFLPATDIFWA